MGSIPFVEGGQVVIVSKEDVKIWEKGLSKEIGKMTTLESDDGNATALLFAFFNFEQNQIIFRRFCGSNDKIQVLNLDEEQIVNHPYADEL